MVVTQFRVVEVMKVLIVSNALSGGGAERTMRWLNREFNSNSIDSILVCLNNSENESPTLNEIVLQRNWKDGFSRTIDNLKEFNRVIRKFEPSVVIINCELPELFMSMCTYRVKHLFCVEHTSRPWDRRRAMGVFVRFALRIRGASWITVNSAQERIWPFGNKFRVIANPVEKPNISHANTSENALAFVGRLREEKGIQLILRAVLKSEASIDIFGSGDLEVELKRKYSHIAKFHGFVSNPWNEIERNQTVIIASQYEGDGIVVVEAMIAGLPLLLIDNKDLRRFALPDKHYFKDEQELIRKIKLVKQNKSEFLVQSEKIEEYLMQRNPSRVLKTWLEVLG